MVVEIIPPIMGAAIRCITSEPVPEPHKMGNIPMITDKTVIIIGRIRSAVPL
jgi:hypothetical protein